METINNKSVVLNITQKRMCNLYGSNSENSIVSDIIISLDEWDDDTNIDKRVGRINMKLINGDIAIDEDYNIVMSCDDESQDLGEVASVFYGHDNQLCDKVCDEVISQLGVIPFGNTILYIDSVNLDSEYNNKETMNNILRVIKSEYSYVSLIVFRLGDFEFNSLDNPDFKLIKKRKVFGQYYVYIP